MTKILIIPDVQNKPGDDTKFLTNIGNFIVKKKPDIIVQLGDFTDMESLSSYDVGKKSHEGKRYIKDIESAQEAMKALLKPLWDYNLNARLTKHKQYQPRLVLTSGNHEHRIIRAVESDSKLDGAISINDLGYESFGWEVYPFLDVVVIEGIAFSHYFVTGVAGRPAGTAAAQLRKTNMSCVAGHQQGKQVAYATRADGGTITSIIAGSCYEHEEPYLGPQGNKHYRGIVVLHDVKEGSFDEMWVNLDYINKKYSLEKNNVTDNS